MFNPKNRKNRLVKVMVTADGATKGSAEIQSLLYTDNFVYLSFNDLYYAVPAGYDADDMISYFIAVDNDGVPAMIGVNENGEIVQPGEGE